MKSKIIKKISQNWKSALTVSLVSIPLSLALAIASGATPTEGIITAFWAGLLGAILGGSDFNVIGPTGALSGLLVSYAIVHGYETLPLIAIFAGLFILVSYILKLDRYIIFIPRSVVHGFTLGVAFIIGLGQLDNALGLNGIPKKEKLLENVWISLGHISEAQWAIFGIFLVSTLFILFWNKKFPKVPGAILMAFVGIVLAVILQKTNSPFQLMTLGDKYPDIHSSLFENIFSKLSWATVLDKGIWMISMATAVIAILETLLSGQIAENMSGVKFNRSKEVLGLGIANIGSGLMGGIPATAALARTALNLKSGANHRTSGLLSAIFVGIIALFLFSFFKLLPMAIIASILVVVAVNMVEKRHFIHLIENEKTSFFLSMFVAVVTVAEDPIAGILTGTFIALLIFANKVANGQTEVLVWNNGKMTESIMKDDFVKRETIQSDIIVYNISGTLTYVNMPAHLKTVEKIRGNKYVIISLRHVFYADTDGIEYLRELIETLKKTNGKIFLTGVNKEVKKLIVKEDFYKKKILENKIYDRTSEALKMILGQQNA